MDQISQVFSALADPTRRAIVARLATGDATVTDLSTPFSISGPAISRHLRVLEEADLIERKISARWRILSLKRDRLAAAQEWINEVRTFWEKSFERIDALLEDQDEAAKSQQTLQPPEE